jgi:hypothetical protein
MVEPNSSDPAKALRDTQLDWIGNSDASLRAPRVWAPLFSSSSNVKKGNAVLLLSVLAAGAVGSYSTGRAEDCFCLSHPTGAFLYNCESYKSPTDYYATAICVDRETGKQSTLTLYGDWKRIKEGADRCDPCKPVPRGTAVEVPRGPERQ